MGVSGDFYGGKKSEGFTLLELIVVIIIIGVLVSLALPRLFSTIEYSRGAEAKATIATLRAAVERYYLFNNQRFPATGILLSSSANLLDIDHPNNAPNSHFKYEIYTQSITKGYIISARRNTVDGSQFNKCVIVMAIGASPTIIKSDCNTSIVMNWDPLLINKITWVSNNIYGKN